jgi:hypothetical protein
MVTETACFKAPSDCVIKPQCCKQRQRIFFHETCRISCRVRDQYPTNIVFLTIYSDSSPLHPTATYLDYSPNYEQVEATASASTFTQQTERPLQPPTIGPFGSKGWQECLLLDGTRYFWNAKFQAVADIDLDKDERLDAITKFLERREIEDLPPQGWELWLRAESGPTTPFIPLKAWVHHRLRKVSPERPSSKPGKVIIESNDSKLRRVYLSRCLR